MDERKANAMLKQGYDDLVAAYTRRTMADEGVKSAEAHMALLYAVFLHRG